MNKKIVCIAISVLVLILGIIFIITKVNNKNIEILNVNGEDIVTENKYYVDKDGFRYIYRSDEQIIDTATHAAAKQIKVYYTSEKEVLKKTKKDVFFRHKLDRNTIISTEIGFKYNNKIYYLNSNDDYEVNKEKLQSIFKKCNTRMLSDDTESFFCNDGDISAFIEEFGEIVKVSSLKTGWSCISDDQHMPYCCFMSKDDENL